MISQSSRPGTRLRPGPISVRRNRAFRPAVLGLDELESRVVPSVTVAPFYVSPTGNDANPGTLAAPWRTIQKAMNSATAGSTVNIRGGTYIERALSVNVTGTAGNFITFQPFGFSATSAGESVVLDYSSMGTITDTTPAVSIAGKNYIRIQGLTFQNFTCTGAMKQGFRIDGGSTNIEILENRLLNWQNIGPWDGSSALLPMAIRAATNVTVSGNEMGNMVTNYGSTITVTASASNTTVANNWIHDTDGIAIDLWNGAANWTVRGNRMEYISQKRDGTYWHSPAAASYCDGANTGVMDGNIVSYAGVAYQALAEPGNPPAFNVTIRNNVARYCDMGLVLGTWYSTTDGSSVHNINVYNNTFYRNNYGVVIRPMTSATVTWENNIFSENTTNYIDTLGWNPGNTGYNLYFGSITGPGATVTADPQFNNAAAGDFTLKSTSPAQGAGDPSTTTDLAGTVDLAGNPRIVGRIDIGAYEFQSASAPPQPSSAVAPPQPGSPAGGVLLSSDFASGNTSGWTPVSTSWITGTWQAQASYNGVSNVYAKTGTAEGISLAGSSSWTNYTFTALVNLENLGGGIALLGRVQDATHYYQLEIKEDSTGQVRWWIWKNNGGTWTNLASGPLSYTAGSWVKLGFTLSGSELTAQMSPASAPSNVTSLGSAVDTTWSSGGVGLRAWGSAGRFAQALVVAV